MAILLFLLGVIFGSFVNAFVWRLRKLETSNGKKVAEAYSITKGRSMCVHCEHVLSARDLIPVVSWITLKGRCRYCGEHISRQYPSVELLTGLLFLSSYIFWPFDVAGMGLALFVVWLVHIVVFVSLAVYDIRWFELPDRIVYPLTGLALMFASGRAIVAHEWSSLLWSLLAGGVLFAIFWLLFQISDGRWIGGGDVKIVFALGILAGTPVLSLLVLFISSLLGTIVGIPVLLQKGRGSGAKIPFGPYLLLATVITVYFGRQLVGWYQNLLLF